MLTYLGRFARDCVADRTGPAASGPSARSRETVRATITAERELAMSILPFDQRDGSIWIDGVMVPWQDAKLHVLSHGLHYGGAVFEGERAYAGKIFKSTEHSRRFKVSAELLDFEIPYSIETLDKAKDEVVAANGGGDVYVRPVAWRGSEMMAVAAQHATVHVAIACWAWPSMFDVEQKMKGIRLDIAEYRRPDPQTAPCRSKAAGLYMICTISKHKAERKGYADALMLDWQGRVAECTGANVFFSRDGALHTPIADCFLDGITRRTVLDLAQQAPRHRGCRAPHHAGRDGGLQRMLHLRHRRRGDPGVRDRALQVHSGQHVARHDGRLFGRSARRLTGAAARLPKPQSLMGVGRRHLLDRCIRIAELAQLRPLPVGDHQRHGIRRRRMRWRLGSRLTLARGGEQELAEGLVDVGHAEPTLIVGIGSAP